MATTTAAFPAFIAWHGDGEAAFDGAALLLKVGVGPVGLDHAASLLRNPARQGELDLAVVHLGDQWPSALPSGDNFAPDDLDGMGPGPVSGSHVTVALGDGRVDGQVPVLAVHVVSSGTRVVPQPNTEVLDLEGVLLPDLLNRDDLSR